GGDTNYSASTGACEPFSVQTTPSAVATTVIDNATGTVWTNTEQTGASAHDTATLVATGLPTRSGTVTYSIFTNASCTAPASSTQTVTVSSAGTVPDSASTAVLAAGGYAYQAGYSGDANYAAATGACEPFSVTAATTSVTTTVIDDAN